MSHTFRRASVALVSFIIASFLTVYADNSALYYKYLDDAGRATNVRNWTDAEAAFQRAIDLEPNNPLNVLLLANIGMVRYYDGRDSLALEALNQAARKAPRSVTILTNRAEVLKGLNRYSEALTDYNTIILLDSLNTDARLNKGIIEMMFGNYDDARTTLTTLAEIEPDSRTTHLGLATIAMHDEDYPATIRHLYIVIDAEPEARYLEWRARCRIEINDLGDASEDIARGLELEPSYGPLYATRARLNKLRYRPDDAAQDALRAIELGEDPTALQEYLPKQ